MTIEQKMRSMLDLQREYVVFVLSHEDCEALLSRHGDHDEV